MKTWLKVLLFVIGLIFLTFAAIVIFRVRSYKIMDKVELITKDVKQSIPFYYSDSGHMLVEVEVNGSDKRYPFMLDSGASTMVFQNLLDEHALPDIGNGFLIGMGGGSLFPDIYRMDQLELGDIQFVNVSAASIEKLPFPCTENIYGILGKEAMQHLVWQIDFEKKQIQIVSDKSKLTFGETAHRISLSENQLGHQLYVGIQLGSDTLKKRFTVDLGNNGYASTNLQNLVEQKGRKINIMGSSSVGLDGENKTKSVYHELDSFIIGDIVIPGFSIYASGGPGNLLGLGILKNFRTTISWKDKQLILEPYEKQYFERKGYGIGSRFDNEKNALIIKTVLEGFPADELGIRLGAKVLSLNGQPMDAAEKYCDFDFKNIDILEVELEQDGMRRVVSLEKQVYFPKVEEEK